MSVDLIVYLQRSAMPTPENWARAICDAGFPIEMETDNFDVDESTGFRPCTCRGVATGFEYFSSALTSEDRAELGLPGNWDFAVNLLTHADLRAFATALVAASVLCHASGGMLVDPQSGKSYQASEIMGWAYSEYWEMEPEF